MTGSAAPKMEAIERELMRLCVEACNVHGWEIPFPQIVMHKVEQAVEEVGLRECRPSGAQRGP